MRSLLYTVAAVAILSQVDGKFKCVYEGLFENSKLNKRGPFLHFYIFDAMKENCTNLLLANNYIRCYPSYKKGKTCCYVRKDLCLPNHLNWAKS